jgi:hypothetical protein
MRNHAEAQEENAHEQAVYQNLSSEILARRPGCYYSRRCVHDRDERVCEPREVASKRVVSQPHDTGSRTGELTWIRRLVRARHRCRRLRPCQLCDRSQRSLRRIQPKPEIVIAIVREHVRRLMMIGIPTVADLRSTFQFT